MNGPSLLLTLCGEVVLWPVVGAELNDPPPTLLLPAEEEDPAERLRVVSSFFETLRDGIKLLPDGLRTGFFEMPTDTLSVFTCSFSADDDDFFTPVVSPTAPRSIFFFTCSKFS